jgi:hypothetical protein
MDVGHGGVGALPGRGGNSATGGATLGLGGGTTPAAERRSGSGAASMDGGEAGPGRAEPCWSRRRL